ncbi:MAG: hypothetical protein IKP68_09755 [Clostridia bacterium]|nr:hypothetical protein [Clostridia bacterium]
MQKSDRFPIGDELRLKAKRRYEKELNKMATTGNTFQIEINVSISKEQDEECVDNSNGTNARFSYGEKWLSETLDYPGILNNFIYLFQFTEYIQMRCNLASVESLAGTLEKTFRPDSRRLYPDYAAFRHLNALAMLQMQAYYHFLQRNKIRYEDVLEWFLPNIHKKNLAVQKYE